MFYSILMFLVWVLGIIVALFLFFWALAFVLRLPFFSIKAQNFIAKVCFPILIFFMRIKTIVVGRENIPELYPKGYCIVSNHQSAYDIGALVAQFPDPVAFIAKKELRQIPFLGSWMITIGCLFIDRSNMRQSLDTITRLGSQKVRDGQPMIIFPEGTRNRQNKLGKFRPGSLRMATEAKAPIVPVTMVNSFMAWRGYPFKSQTVTMHVHPIIPYETYKDMKITELCDMIEDIIASSLPNEE